MPLPNPNNDTRKGLFKEIYNLSSSFQSVNFSLLEKIETIESLNNCILKLNELRASCKSHYAFPDHLLDKFSSKTFTINSIIATELLKKIKNISAMVGSIPEVFYKENIEYFRKEYEGFDANIFLTALPTLQLKKNYRLNYSYSFSFLAGAPSIFAVNKITNDKSDYYADRYSYLKFIDLPAEPLAFFQLALLANQLDQFYLYWHSCYAENEIILSTDQAETILDSKTGLKGPPFSQEHLNSIRLIDFTPTVKTNYEIFEVKLVCFNAWSGFQNVHYSFSHPASSLVIHKETLVEYNCCIRF